VRPSRDEGLCEDNLMKEATKWLPPRFGTPEEIADGMTHLVSAGVTIDDRRCRADGRRDQGHLGTAGEEEWSVGDF
jgi:hypothetical protein